MQIVQLMFESPVHLELWLVIVYVAMVLIGARVIELLARLHMAHANQNAEAGFEYLEDEDRYHCAGGERLALESVEPSRQMAIYQALPHQCQSCHWKETCAPHGKGRRIYRSLATWAETDVGRFHKRISLLMFAAGSLLATVGMWRWNGSPGTGYLLLSLVLSSSCMIWELWSAAKNVSPGLGATVPLPKYSASLAAKAVRLPEELNFPR